MTLLTETNPLKTKSKLKRKEFEDAKTETEVAE